MPAAVLAGSVVDSLPTAERWLAHYRHDLGRFWVRPELIGNPPGHYPTEVLRDGATLEDPMPSHGDSVRERHGVRSRQMHFSVALSRQAYLYLVGYHLTGDTALLTIAKAGIDFLLSDMRTQDGAFHYMMDGAGRTMCLHDDYGRPTQLCPAESYGLLAPAMYYYLTRDPDMLWAARQTRARILKVFGGGNPDWRLLMEASTQPEVASLGTQLDIINGFMFLMTPTLARDEARVWQADMGRLLANMVDWMYCEKVQAFRQRVSRWKRPTELPVSQSFGYDAKAFWYLYLYGQRYGVPEYCNLSLKASRALAKRSYMPDMEGWSREGPIKGEPERELNHWTYAECDQLMETLALRDTSFARNLPRTTRTYFEHLVDTVFGGVYDGVGPDLRPSEEQMRKGAPWKHDFHASEHALVGYITAHAIRGEPVPLYYAFGSGVPDTATITPYHFTGTVSAVEDLGAMAGKSLRKCRVTFTGVR